MANLFWHDAHLKLDANQGKGQVQLSWDATWIFLVLRQSYIESGTETLYPAAAWSVIVAVLGYETC